jgi:hypothetical protein
MMGTSARLVALSSLLLASYCSAAPRYFSQDQAFLEPVSRYHLTYLGFIYYTFLMLRS